MGAEGGPRGVAATAELEANSNSDHPTASHDPLSDAVSTAFLALSTNDVDALQAQAAPYQHSRAVRIVMRVAGRDPRCTPKSDLFICGIVLAGFVFTACWQITAVVVAAKFDLDLTVPLRYLVLAGAVVAMAVVLFDWQMIQSHVNGVSSPKMWAARALFTVCMILLVSEVAASAFFSRDILAQAQQDGRGAAQDLQQTQAGFREQIDGQKKAVKALQSKLAADKSAVLRFQNARDSEEHGYGTLAGRGPKWHLADHKLQAAVLAEQGAQAAVDDPSTGVAADEARIADLQAAMGSAGATSGYIPPDQLGPGEREAALWKYMLAHPAALFLKRIPLFVLLVCLDTFALLVGMAVSARTREAHLGWAEEQTEWAVAARFVRARILQEAKGVIGRMVRDGMRGSAEQLAVRQRWQRAMQTSTNYAQDTRDYEKDMQAMGIQGDWSTDYSYLPAPPRGAPVTRLGVPPAPRTSTGADSRGGGTASSAQDKETIVDLTAFDPRATARTGRSRPPATGGAGNGHTHGSSFVDGVAGTDDYPNDAVTRVLAPYSLPEPQQRHAVPVRDPARQLEADLAPYLNRFYETDGPRVRAVGPLSDVLRAYSARATLLRGKDDDGRNYVIKIFSTSSKVTDDQIEDELGRDAANASRMAEVTGGLTRVAADSNRWLAPGYFGTLMTDSKLVPYLISPLYPSGSIRNYLLTERDVPLTLDWCLRVSEQMFRACAAIAERGVIGCDAKLDNFVFAQGEYADRLAPEVARNLRPGVSVGEGNGPSVRMIDLSMVYIPGEMDVDRATRSSRGTAGWSSPRAVGVDPDGRLNRALSSMDDAYTVAVNTMYLLTELQVPTSGYRYGSRVELETLAPQDLDQQEKLIDLSRSLAALADDTTVGPHPEHYLQHSQDWLRRWSVPERVACAGVATYLSRVRLELDETVLQQQFRRLPFVSMNDRDV